MNIIIDFDGTCVTHEYPYIGQDIGAVPVLKELVENGHKLTLFTMRSSKNGTLEKAIRWFSENEIPLNGIQSTPGQGVWTDSPKAYGELIIDDTCLGIPLTSTSGYTFVNWEKVREMLVELKIISDAQDSII